MYLSGGGKQESLGDGACIYQETHMSGRLLLCDASSLDDDCLDSFIHYALIAY